MKGLGIFLLVVASLSGQGKNLQFVPITDMPLDFSQVGDDDAYVQGDWVAMDKHSELAGISTSEIICSRKGMVCHESQANLTIMGNAFTLRPDYLDYKITRWNSREIVANNISGICRVNNSLKFDRKNKKVYFLATLSEPVENLPKMSKEICNAAGEQRLELQGNTMYREDTKQ